MNAMLLALVSLTTFAAPVAESNSLPPVNTANSAPTSSCKEKIQLAGGSPPLWLRVG